MLKIEKKYLLLFTSIIWLWASFVLLRKSYSWAQDFALKELLITLSIGVIIASIKTIFIFKRLTINNIQRIAGFNEELVSIWEFHLTKDKILIIVMIVGGTLLRKSSFIPTIYLMPVYLGIGLAMFYSFGLYIKFVITNNKK